MRLIIILFLFLPYEILYSMDEYFLTLRNGQVNLRQGPSFDYPVKRPTTLNELFVHCWKVGLNSQQPFGNTKDLPNMVFSVEGS